MESTRRVLAAGAIVWRERKGHTQVLIIHRPKYDDWSFPKGKLDRGEELPETAVREVEEETGVRVRLGVPLLTMEYPTRFPAGDVKVASYWAARPVGDDDVSGFKPNREVDAVRWVRLRDVDELLTYKRDREVLELFAELHARDAHDTRTLIVLRHSPSRSRSRWQGDDHLRTLTKAGETHARRIVPTLGAYGVKRVWSSDAVRCFRTVEPYADEIDADIILEPALSEEEATRKQVRRTIKSATKAKAPVVVATHRPVLPWVFEKLGIADPGLAPGAFVVVHHRAGDVIGYEHYKR